MILDDDPILSKRLSEYLNQVLPFHVITFEKAEDAFSALNSCQYEFCAFILDIELTGQKHTGIDVAEIIKSNAQTSSKPIFFLTSYKHFGYGSLRHLHYYDFFTKNTDFEKIATSIENAILPHNDEKLKSPIISLQGLFCVYEIKLNDISCIEQFGKEIVITDLSGHVSSYRVKPCAFIHVCKQIEQLNYKKFQQVHRSIILNFHRIQKIEWHKNTASVFLFNTPDCKPVGKTYLEKLKIFKE